MGACDCVGVKVCVGACDCVGVKVCVPCMTQSTISIMHAVVSYNKIYPQI